MHLSLLLQINSITMIPKNNNTIWTVTFLIDFCLVVSIKGVRSCKIVFFGYCCCTCTGLCSVQQRQVLWKIRYGPLIITFLPHIHTHVYVWVCVCVFVFCVCVCVCVHASMCMLKGEAERQRETFLQTFSNLH